MNLRDTLKINNEGILEIGGITATELVEKYGSPIYAVDVAHVRKLIRAFKNTVATTYGLGGVAYASKAFSCKAIYHIMKEEDMYIDVVTGGEIFTALSAGFDLSKAYFHGNNKSVEELKLAVDNNIGIVVIDNLEEIDILNKICTDNGKVQNVNLRLNPGVEAHTHSYIQTAKIESKFGFSISNGDAGVAISKILAADSLHFNGINCHIGSQIFDSSSFRLAVDVMTDYIVQIRKEFGIDVDELNMGGGYGVHYVESDPKYDVDEYCNYIKVTTEALNEAVETKKIKKPRLMLEPGRALIGEAGITLYRVGNIKNIANIKKYVCIDGGMFDNIRPALYDAEYEAIIANRCNDAKTEYVAITGKCCESADILINKIKLPEAKRGDILAVFTTGAYNYSMANNYNRNAVPPVIFVEDGESDYAVRPQTYEDIIRNDNIPYFMEKKKC